MASHDDELPGVARFDEAGDATRRSHLANERTYLAWWRTGLTCFAVSFGAGKVVPALSDVATWPYATLGVIFGLLGLFFVGYGYRRHQRVRDALRRGDFEQPDEGVLVAVTAVGVVAGILLIALILSAG